MAYWYLIDIMVYKFVLTGHVDHSKSSIAGRILYESKYYDQHIIDEIFKKAQQDGAYNQRFSRLLDISEEEQIKGKTMDFSEIDFSSGDKNYKLIDTPGHKLLLPKLINGLSRHNPAEIMGVLVVSSIKKEFESGWNGGQTKEDIMILRSIGVTNFIIAISKIDVGDRDNVKNIYNEVSKYMKGMWGIKECRHCCVSAYTGEGIDELLQMIDIPSSGGEDKDEYYTTDTIKVKMYVFTKNIVITRGYSILCHFIDPDREEPIFANIIKIEKVQTVKIGEETIVVLKINEKIITKKNMRILLRNSGNETIGMAQIISLIPIQTNF